MNISKLTKALSPANLAELSEITISPDFSITILQVAGINQHYQAAVAKFALVNPQHPLFTDAMTFLSDVWAAKVTPDTLQFLAYVVVNNWSLTDDDGELQQYYPEAFIELFTGPDPFQRAIPAKLLKACTADSTFKVDLIVKP